MSDWTIEEVAPKKKDVPSTWDVFQDRRVVHYDFDDLDQATEFVRRHRSFDPEEDTVISVTVRGEREPVDVRGR